jgi:hypothetical protein
MHNIFVLQKNTIFFTEHVVQIVPDDSKPEAKKLKPQGDEPISSVETDVNQLPLMVSDALATFFGTGEREMVHSEAVKRVWDHIKSNDLEVWMISIRTAMCYCSFLKCWVQY